MEAKQLNMALGFDYSRWQGVIDWQKLRYQAAFAFGKATDGTTYIDPDFSRNYEGCKSSKIIRGAYHFAQPGLGDPAGQAQHYVNTVKEAGGFDGLPPMLDVEVSAGLSKSALALWIRTFANAVKVATGRSVILYTYLSFALQHFEPSLANEFSLFIADYGVNQPPNVLGWTKWLFFQYTDSGNLPGISGHVDLDVFDGTTADLQKFLGGVDSVEPIRDVDMVLVVDADVLNIRAGAGVDNPVRYQVKRGEELHVTKIQGEWSYTTYGSLGGWVVNKYLAPVYPPVKVQIDGKDVDNGIAINGSTYVPLKAFGDPNVARQAVVTYLGVPYVLYTQLTDYTPAQIKGGWNFVKKAPEIPTEAPGVPDAPEQAPKAPTEAPGASGDVSNVLSEIEYHLTAVQTLLNTLKGAK